MKKIIVFLTVALLAMGLTMSCDPGLKVDVSDGQQTNRSLANVIAISCGDDFSLALQSTGYVLGTGNNTTGQLGDGTWTSKTSWVTTIGDVKAISCGAGHSLVLKTDGTVWATGYNYYGQLGNADQKYANQCRWVQVYYAW
jgi:alpha-tubulin suppressor-like RCC1 family protein